MDAIRRHSALGTIDWLMRSFGFVSRLAAFWPLFAHLSVEKRENFLFIQSCTAYLLLVFTVKPVQVFFFCFFYQIVFVATVACWLVSARVHIRRKTSHSWFVRTPFFFFLLMIVILISLGIFAPGVTGQFSYNVIGKANTVPVHLRGDKKKMCHTAIQYIQASRFITLYCNSFAVITIWEAIFIRGLP